MSVFRITLTSRNPRTGEPHFVNFDCPAAPTIEHLVADLNEGKLVIGDILTTRKSSKTGVWEVIGRRPMSLAKRGVAHIEVPAFGFFEYEEPAHDQA